VSNSNPDVTVEAVRERVRGSFPDRIGIELMEITDERTLGRLVVAEEHLHPGRLLHGGVWVALTDSVGAWQTIRHLPTGHDFTTVELKLNVFAAAATGDELIATAEHLHAGRSTHVVQVKVEKDDRLAANLILTQFIIPPRAVASAQH
jgi:1,4-dihydroxy-2-naphthoyl-CoA hydrolase